MRDRDSIVDLVLAFSATFVVALLFWPQRPAHQIVRCNLADDHWQEYSAPVGDPSLETLRAKLRRWQTPEFHPRFATAKWQREVAEFYQRAGAVPRESNQGGALPSVRESSPTTARLTDSVAFASYEAEFGTVSEPIERTDYQVNPSTDPNGVDEDHAATSPSDADYWRKVKANAEVSMKEVEQKIENAPIVFAGTTSPGWPQLAFHSAFLLGLCAACGYMHWTRLTPTHRGKSFHQQSLGVLARLGTFAGAIAFALVGAAAIWMK